MIFRAQQMSTSAPCQFLQGQYITLSAFKVDLVAISRQGNALSLRNIKVLSGRRT